MRVDDNRSLCAALEDETMTEYELEAGKYRFVLAGIAEPRDAEKEKK